MFKRFLIAFIILLLLFLFLAKRGAGAQNIAFTQTPPEGAVLLLNLPNVYILPTSPLYPVILFWEQLRLLLATTPEERTQLFLLLAETKMAETVRILEDKNGRIQEDKRVQVGVLVDNYQEYLNQAYRFFNLVQNPQKREELYWELQKQGKNFELFKSFLEKIGVQVEWEIPL